MVAMSAHQETADPLIILGKLAIKYGMAQREQIREALAYQRVQKEEGKEIPLGEILVSRGILSADQLDHLLDVQSFLVRRQKDKRFATAAVQLGLASPQSVEGALNDQLEEFRQRRIVRPLGAILVERGILTEEDQEKVLTFLSEGNIEGAPPEFRAPSQPARPPAETVETPPRREGAEDLRDAAVPEAPPPWMKDLFSVEASSDGMEAYLVVRGLVAEAPTAAALKAFVRSNGIVGELFPLSLVVDTLNKRPKKDTKISIAQGTPPKPGRDARITYYFDTDPLKIGTIRSGGKIDFRERGEIPQVRPDDLLAEKIPKVKGEPGTDVHGKKIQPPEPRDVRLRCGPGARLSENGLKAYAAKHGSPAVTADGKILVNPEHVIRGNVDLNTGHVDFEGAVLVTGTIEDGFRVRCNSLAAGEITKAEIETQGNVTVSGGIIGARIHAQGALRARHVFGATIRTSGDIVVESSIVDCTIETSGACIVRSGKILSSNVIAKQGIEALQIGSEQSRACRLTFGVDSKLKEDLAVLGQRIAMCRDRMHRQMNAEGKLKGLVERTELKVGSLAVVQDQATRELRTIEAKASQGEAAADPDTARRVSRLEARIQEAEKELERLFDLEDRIKKKIGDVAAKKQSLQLAMDHLRAEMEALAEWGKSNRAPAVIKVYDTVMPGTEIRGRWSSMKVGGELKRVLFKEVKVDEPEMPAAVQAKITVRPLES